MNGCLFFIFSFSMRIFSADHESVEQTQPRPQAFTRLSSDSVRLGAKHDNES